MAIDASIYSNIQAPQINVPSPLDVAQKAMSLSTLGMQQMQMQRQMQTQQAMRQAYANNTDPQTGQLNQSGFLSDLGKNPYTASSVPEMQNTFSATAKNQADSQAAQADAKSKIIGLTLPAMQYVHDASDDQKPAAFNSAMQSLKAQGLPMQTVPQTSDGQYIYDPNWFQQTYKTLQNSKQGLDAQNAQADLQVKQSEVNKNNADQFKTGAEELGKLNEDVNNASSRKTTGMLIQGRDRADRIVSLLQPLPNESPQQTTARLNNYIPQVGTEIGTSLGAIMQGGVPDETIQKELAPTTIQSQLASLNQKVTGNPTGGNQAALLKSYGDIAQKLRDFSASRLQEISDRSKSAYPYANKLFPNEVAKITSPITSPGASNGAGDTQQAGTTPLAQATQSPNPSQAPTKDYAGAIQWLKTADPSSPKAFAVRAKLKAAGYNQ